MNENRALAAELIGTFWLVLGGCGAAALGGDYVGVALAFGLAVLTGAYAIGHISGGHFNPAVTIGLVVGNRFDRAKAVGYVVAQVVGAVLAAGTLFLITSNVGGFDGSIGQQALANVSNGFGDRSPQGYGLGAALIVEIVLSAMFLIVIMGVTSREATPATAGLTIGLCLTLIHLVSIPVTNTSVNPARSTGPAIFGGSAPLGQLWLFWVAPIVGAVIGALIHRTVLDGPDSPER